MQSTIKRVGNTSIVLEDTCLLNTTALILGAVMVIIGIGLIICVAINMVDIPIVELVGCMFIFSGLASMSILPIIFSHPGYKVRINEYSSIGIEIKKTSDLAADQVLICKDAKELEAEAQQIEGHNTEIERLAKGCK